MPSTTWRKICHDSSASDLSMSFFLKMTTSCSSRFAAAVPAMTVKSSIACSSTQTYRSSCRLQWHLHSSILPQNGHGVMQKSGRVRKQSKSQLESHGTVRSNLPHSSSNVSKISLAAGSAFFTCGPTCETNMRFAFEVPRSSRLVGHTDTRVCMRGFGLREVPRM
jgi:hypothetical protein